VAVLFDPQNCTVYRARYRGKDGHDKGLSRHEGKAFVSLDAGPPLVRHIVFDLHCAPPFLAHASFEFPTAVRYICKKKPFLWRESMARCTIAIPADAAHVLCDPSAREPAI
jgi:hypothetical protein